MSQSASPWRSSGSSSRSLASEEAAERETLLAEQLAELRRALNQRQFSRALQLLLAAWRTDRPDRSEFIGQLEVLASREPPPLADLED